MKLNVSGAHSTDRGKIKEGGNAIGIVKSAEVRSEDPVGDPEQDLRRSHETDKLLEGDAGLEGGKRGKNRRLARSMLQ